MSEQPHEQPEGASGANYEALFQEANPKTVSDKKKAELMAYAGDEYETKVVEDRQKALEHASKVDDPDGYDHRGAAIAHVEEAEDARRMADEKEGTVGYIYDRTKDL